MLALDGLAAAEATDTLDRAMLAGLAGVVDEATAAFEAYEPARALEAGEAFFWSFCDDYLELVKGGLRGGRPGRPGVGRRGPAPGPGHAGAPVRPRAAVRHRGGLVVVAGRLGAPQPLAGGVRCGPPPAWRGPAPWPWRRPPPSWPRSAGPRPPPGCPCAPAGRVGVADRPERLAVLAEVAADLCRAGHVADLALLDPADTLTVTVDLPGG